MFSLPNHIHVYEFSLGRRRRSVSSIKPSLAWHGVERHYWVLAWLWSRRLPGHIQTSALPRILSRAPASHCHSHTHSLFIFTSAWTLPLPGFNMPSFILHFSEDSIYLLYIFLWHIFQPPFHFFFFHTLPSLLSSPSLSAVPLPLKQSSFFLSLFIYMTPRFLSEAGADGKRQAFYKTVQV